MDSDFVLPVAVTFVASIFLSLLTLYFFPRWGLMDRPERYGHKRKPIPLPGGVAPVLTICLSLLFFFPGDPKIFGLVIALVIVAVISFWDDRRGLSPQVRLVAHVVAAGVAVSAGIRIEYLGNPLGDVLNLGSIFFLLPAIITILWLVGFANVLNWLDGVPGLSAASASSAGIFLGILSLTSLVSQPETALLSLLFAASAAGFLFFNIPPPRMLLGDTGAMVFGFTLAAISVFSGGKMATVFVVLAIPMLDAAYVVVRRILSGRNPLRGKDNLHLHDRLIEIGLSERQVLIFFLTLSVFLGWFSLQLQTAGKMYLILGTSFAFLLFSGILETILRGKISNASHE